MGQHPVLREGSANISLITVVDIPQRLEKGTGNPFPSQPQGNPIHMPGNSHGRNSISPDKIRNPLGRGPPDKVPQFPFIICRRQAIKRDIHDLQRIFQVMIVIAEGKGDDSP